MKKLLSLLFIACLLNMGNVYAVSATYGVVNIQQVLAQSTTLQTLRKDLASKVEGLQNQTKKLYNSVQQAQNALKQAITPAAKTQAQQQLKTVQDKFKGDLANLRTVQQQQVKKLKDALQQAIAEVAKKTKLQIVYVKQMLVYSSDAYVDITKDVIKALS
ncbi:MAG: OmpH family outer membrane protein [Gammaproteobacteria bacterium]|nr:OmpH family outer membrane protein [Gammaproteobacteria bacterium]MBL4743971.1 OmpH family outer membrane protein [Cycloclasticus sp.]